MTYTDSGFGKYNIPPGSLKEELARLAPARAVAVHSKVGARIFVAARAMRFGALPSRVDGSSCAATDVFNMSNRFEMVRVHAKRDTALMVKFVTIRYWALDYLVENAMRLPAGTFVFHASVTAAVVA